MKNKYVKIAVFTALGLGAIYGGYKLFKFIKDGNDSNGGGDEGAVITTEEAKKAPSAPKFDANKIVKKGSKGGEVKTIQTAFNNIIDDAKKVNLLTLDSNIEKPKATGLVDDFLFKLKLSNEIDGLSDKAKRIKAVKSISKLTVDGDFGTITESACQIIMGKKSVSYSEVKQKRIDFANVYGLPKPY
jgi:hypothetical protein